MIKLEFEGTDGAGKTTGLKYFIDRAKSKGLTIVETREVGNPNVPSCVKMREFVLDAKNNLSGEAMELIFSAMRYENDKWLKRLSESADAPALVVSDRGWFSHLAYTDHNVSPKFTTELYSNLVAKQTKLPDVVIYFSVNTDIALKRRVRRGETMDVIEMKGVEFQDKVRDSFLNHLYEYSGQVEIFHVDANNDILGVQRQLDDILEELEVIYFS